MFVVWVWVSASQKITLFWRETHTKGLSARFPTRPEEDEGRKVPESAAENRPIDGIGRSAEEGRTEIAGWLT